MHIVELFQKLKDNDLAHGDAHFKNIAYRNNFTSFIWIDFGEARNIVGGNVIQDVNQLLRCQILGLFEDIMGCFDTLNKCPFYATGEKVSSPIFTLVTNNYVHLRKAPWLGGWLGTS